MDRIDAAFAATPRDGFLTPATRSQSGADHPLPIGHGQTNSQPRTVRDMLALLDVQVGARVLDVGAGSGWTTALLAHLVGPSGSVIGTEIVPLLRAWGAGNLARCGRPNARIEAARPDVLGWPDGAPYDRILVSAMAAALPRVLLEQLADGGIAVLPVAGRMARVVRHGAALDVSWGRRYLFVPLIEPSKPRMSG